MFAIVSAVKDPILEYKAQIQEAYSSVIISHNSVSSYILVSKPTYPIKPLSLTTHVCSYIIISHNPRVLLQHYQSTNLSSYQ